ncbi:MAG TPA: response regulator [Fibrobacteria bacterium]|nr:response regulator [Fibrobacteria bacterium]
MSAKEITKLIRVLIVEDSEEDSELIKFELDRGGIEHFNRRVATEAEFSAALEGSKWDVILSDYSLPGFGGLKALQMLKAREIDIPFILISGTIGEDIAVETMKAGAHDYLIKGKLSRLIPIIYREMREFEIRSSHRKIQDVIRKSEERLRIAQKMEAVGRLAGGIAHNFNNLLTVMSGYNEMALASLDPAHALRGDLEQVKDSVAKATFLTRQLLDFSRGKVMAPQPMDLNAAVRETHQMLVPMIRADIEFTLQTEAGQSRIKADPVQIRQIVMNLVLNARDAMPAGGKLQLRTGNAFLKEPFPDFATRFKPGPYVTFTVEDSGIGMDEKTREHVFEPFFTTKEFGKGTGLGLATVYGIVSHCGGQIQVQSQPGKGSTFCVYFPSLEGNISLPPPVPAAKPESGALPRGAGSILLAENDDGVRTLVLHVLRRNGYQVLAASNGEEALQLSQECERIHLLLTDVVMPGMSGMQLANRLSQLHPESKIIFMSGYNVADIESERYANLSLDILEKPFSPERLLRKIQATLA